MTANVCIGFIVERKCSVILCLDDRCEVALGTRHLVRKCKTAKKALHQQLARVQVVLLQSLKFGEPFIWLQIIQLALELAYSSSCNRNISIGEGKRSLH